MDLDVFSSDEGFELLKQIVGERRVERERAAAENIVQMTGGLAIALSVAAARLRSSPAWSLAEYATCLQDTRRQLPELRVGRRTVAAVFSLSYEPLPEAHRHVFRLFSLHPGDDVTPDSVAALAGLTRDEAFDTLEDLLDICLLQQNTPGRYRMHDLVRSYAHQCADSEETPESRRDAVERVLTWYLYMSRNTIRVLAPARRGRMAPIDDFPTPPGILEVTDYDHALAWCDAERINLTASVSIANVEEFHFIAARLARMLYPFHELRKYQDDMITTSLIGVDSARRINDLESQAVLLNILGNGHVAVRQFDEAIGFIQQALLISQETENARREAALLNDLGIVLYNLRRYDEAIAFYERALPLRRSSGDQFGEGNTLNNLGEVYRSLHRYSDALGSYQLALPLRRNVADRLGEGTTLNNMGKVLLSLGDLDQAQSYLLQALAIRQNIGDQWGTARTSIHIGRIFAQKGRVAEARELWSRSLEIFDKLDDPRGMVVRSHLAELAERNAN